MKLTANRKTIWSIAYPIMLTGIAQNIVGLTDTAFLGRYSEVALGAVGLASIGFWVYAVFAYSLGSGLQILVARRLGQDEPELVGRLLRVGFVLSLVMGVGLTAAVWWTSGPVAYGVFQSEAVAAASVEYLQARAPEVFFAFLFQVLRGFYSGLGRTQVLAWAAGIQTVVNLVLDYGLIFGELGLPGMGVAGAGLASQLGQVAALLFIGAMYLRSGYPAAYGVRLWGPWAWEPFHNLVKLTGPIIVQHALSLVTFFGFMLLIEQRGETELAASNIVKSVYLALMIPTWGFAGAANTLLSNLAGQGMRQAIRPAAKRIGLFSVAVTAPFLLLTVLFPEAVSRLFTDETGALLQLSVQSLYPMCAGLLLYAFGGVLASCVMGLGATRQVLIMELAILVVYLAYVTTAVQLGFPLWGVWMAEMVYMGMLILLAGWYLRSNRWEKLVSTRQEALPPAEGDECLMGVTLGRTVAYTDYELEST